MPTTLSALLVLLLAVVPGVPGDRFFRLTAGSDRGEQQWERVLRIIVISVGGLMLYVLVASFVSFPLPPYTAIQLGKIESSNEWRDLAFFFIGHCTGATMLGCLGGCLVCLLDKWTGASPYLDGWSDFVNKCVPNHWVVVNLHENKVYAGILEHADITTDSDARDIILREPAIYVPDDENYKSLSYQHLFLPGSLISSIATISSNPDKDKRICPEGEMLFERKTNEQRK